MSAGNRELRDALGQFPTGVVIVTGAAPDGELIGMTMSSFNSVSLDPPLVLFSVHKKALSFTRWQSMKHYAINILSEDQEDLSNRFARAQGEKWQGVQPAKGKYGVPLIADALVTFECEAHARYDGGDHDIFVGKVVHLHRSRSQHDHPLVFANGRYRRLDKTAHDRPSDVADLHGWVADLGGW